MGQDEDAPVGDLSASLPDNLRQGLADGAMWLEEVIFVAKAGRP